MLRTGEQYLERLRDGREVHVGREIVSDVTTHPAFRNAVRSVARMYDAVCERPDELAYRDTEGGELYNAIWLRPKTAEDLASRRRVHTALAEVSHGLIGRSPDHVAAYLTGMACEPEVANVHGQGFDKNVLAYWEYVRKNDLYVSYAIAPPARARAPEVTGAKTTTAAPTDPNQSSALRVVAENEAGITVWGTKILATAAVLADEMLLGNLLPLAPGEEAFAVTFAVPNATPGLKLLPRKSYELGANALDDPLASRYDEGDAVVFCDNVFVPWDRVFTYNHLDTGLAIFNNTPAHVLGNAQAHSRLLAKMRLMLGVIRRVSEMTGTYQIPAVREMIAARAIEVAVVEALITASDAVPERWPSGYVSPNRQNLYALMAWSAEMFPTFLHGVRELLGSQPFQLAHDAGVFEDAETIGLLVDALGLSTPENARERYKVLKLAWDLIGSEFASRHLQYEMFYAGAKHVTRARLAHHFDWRTVEETTDRALAELDDWVAASADEPVAG